MTVMVVCDTPSSVISSSSSWGSSYNLFGELKEGQDKKDIYLFRKENFTTSFDGVQMTR